MKSAFVIIRAAYREQAFSPVKSLVTGLTFFSKAALLGYAWYAIAVSSGRPNTEALALAVFPFLAMLFPTSEIRGQLQFEITSGEISTRLTHPISLYLYYGCHMLGRWLFYFSILAPLALVLLFVLKGFLSIQWNILPLAFALSLIGALILTLERLTIEACAFWLKDSFSLNHIHNSVRLLLTGALLPPAAIPEEARSYFAYSPYALGVSTPVRLLTDSQFVFNAKWAAGCLFTYLFLISALLYLLGRQIHSKVFVNGG